MSAAKMSRRAKPGKPYACKPGANAGPNQARKTTLLPIILATRSPRVVTQRNACAMRKPVIQSTAQSPPETCAPSGYCVEPEESCSAQSPEIEARMRETRMQSAGRIAFGQKLISAVFPGD